MHSDAVSVPPVHPFNKDVFDSRDSGQFVVLSNKKHWIPYGYSHGTILDMVDFL